MRKETILNYKNFLWLWISIGLCILCTILYVLDDPIGGPNGGTYLGYALGTLGTIIILYLTWYGIRKRSYYSKLTTLKGVLASHIWLGLTLILIVPLHSGFSFGWNVHTLTYALMLGTIISGVWGVYLFRTYPFLLYSQRGGASASQLAASLYALNQELLNFINNKDRQLSKEFTDLIRRLDENLKVSFFNLFLKNRLKPIENEAMSDIVGELPRDEQSEALNLLKIIDRKRQVVKQLQEEAFAQNLIRGWLYLHLPVSIGLIVALAIHIFSVFYYR